jgi:RNA polymerase sigma-70 factor (ECF subfamily)
MDGPDSTATPFEMNGRGEQVKRAAAGDMAAREALYRWAFPAVHRYLYTRASGEREDVADLCADVFVAAFRELPRLKQTEAFWPWLLKIASNRLTDHQRHAVRKRKATGVLAAVAAAESSGQGASQPEDAFERKDERERLRRALSRLTPDHQEALRLRFVEDCSYAEIGRRMDKTEKAVESLLARARDSLRRAMEQDERESVAPHPAPRIHEERETGEGLP